MNKKVLVLTLALVVAFASSAMAAVNFGGEFGAKIEQDILTWNDDDVYTDWKKDLIAGEDSFGFFNGDFGFSHNIKLNLKSSSDTWSLTANFKNKADAGADFAALDGDTGYTLKVNDDLFALTAWQGGKNNQGYVNDPFSLVRGRNQNAASTIRAKAPIMDVADVTLQLEPGSSVLGFVTADVAGAEVGLAVQRKFNDTVLPTLAGAEYGYNASKNVMEVTTPAETRAANPAYATIENALDTVVLHAAYDFEVAKVTVGGGMSMNNTKEPANYEKLTPDQKKVVDEKYLADLKDAFSYAVKVEAPVTDQIKAEASYVVKQEGWKGNGSNSTAATLKGTYKAEDLTVNGNVTSTGKQKNDTDKDNRTTTFALDGTYNITADIKATAGAEYKIEKDKFAAQTENINTTKINASVSAPIVADLATAEVKLGYTVDNLGAIRVGTYYANPAGHTQATALLTRNHSSFALAKTLFEAGASVKVTPIEKLTVTPAVEYKSFKDGNDTAVAADIRKLRDADYHNQYIPYSFIAGSILTLKADATYKVGGGATITLSAGNHTYDFTKISSGAVNPNGYESLKYNNPFASVAVKVTF